MVEVDACGVFESGRGRADAFNRCPDVLIEPHARSCPWIDDLSAQSEAALLKSVEGIYEVRILVDRVIRLFEYEPGNALHVARKRGRTIDRQRCVEYAHFYGSLLRFGANVPIEVLHAFNDPGGTHFFKECVELFPIMHERHAATQRERSHRVHARAIKCGIDPA